MTSATRATAIAALRRAAEAEAPDSASQQVIIACAFVLLEGLLDDFTGIRAELARIAAAVEQAR